MNEIIVNGLFTIGGAMIVGLGTFIVMYMQNKRDKERKKLIQELLYTAEQVKSYWVLESFYYEELSKGSDKAGVPFRQNFATK